MSTKEVQEQLAENMKQWQKVENASISSTAKVMEQTDNAVIRQIMEIIQQDSAMHYHIQGLIVRSLEEESLSMNPDELVNVWDLIEHHIKLEKKTITLAEEALEALKGKKMVLQEYLINYLLMDEEKHNKLLESLEKIKSGMYPYG
ncbi:hypothetical protein ACFL7D_01755 [candidate division KSB1 bacterium]